MPRYVHLVLRPQAVHLVDGRHYDACTGDACTGNNGDARLPWRAVHHDNVIDLRRARHIVLDGLVVHRPEAIGPGNRHRGGTTEC
jgi:hypothetical protein